MMNSAGTSSTGTSSDDDTDAALNIKSLSALTALAAGGLVALLL